MALKIILLFICVSQVLLSQEVDSMVIVKIQKGIDEGESVNFEWGTAICPGAEVNKANNLMISSLKSFLENNDHVKVELRCYTDCRGNDEYNKLLSQRRAEKLVNWLHENGISKNQIIPIGVGEEKPMVNCELCECTREIHKKNNRIEIVKVD